VHGTAANGKTSAFRVAIKRGMLRRKRVLTPKPMKPNIRGLIALARAAYDYPASESAVNAPPDKRVIGDFPGYRAALKIRKLSALIGYTETRAEVRALKLQSRANDPRDGGKKETIAFARTAIAARSHDASRRAVI